MFPYSCSINKGTKYCVQPMLYVWQDLKLFPFAQIMSDASAFPGKLRHMDRVSSNKYNKGSQIHATQCRIKLPFCNLLKSAHFRPTNVIWRKESDFNSTQPAVTSEFLGTGRTLFCIYWILSLWQNRSREELLPANGVWKDTRCPCIRDALSVY